MKEFDVGFVGKKREIDLWSHRLLFILFAFYYTHLLTTAALFLRAQRCDNKMELNLFCLLKKN